MIVRYAILSKTIEPPTVEVLQQAYRERSESLLLLKTDPWLDPLRGDARFQELIKRIGFG